VDSRQQPGHPQGDNAQGGVHGGQQGGNQQAARLLGDAIAQVQRVIVGQEHMVEQLMVSLLAKGHCLLEGVPGVAKTLAVRSFATVVGGDFARIQFTPDLVPSDIVGTRSKGEPGILRRRAGSRVRQLYPRRRGHRAPAKCAARCSS
jgi:hypothetical protein